MTERTRAVIIDDRDSRVQLTGSWRAESGNAYNNQGRHGPVYRNTLTGSSTDGAKLSFTFSGTKAEIMGTTDPKFEDGSTDPDPNWDCVLDGRVNSAAKGASSGPGEGSINRWPFCTFSDLVPGEHTIELTVRTKGRTFWFDDIIYVPTDVVSGETIEVGQDDQDISYSAGWEDYRGNTFITRVKGSTATFPFSGTGITLLSNYHTDLSSNPSAGTYSIDGGSPVPFTIRGGGSSDDYNRRAFEVFGLSAGTHTLVVTYQGSDGTMPLVIDRFFIEGGTNLRAQSSPTSSGVGPSATELPSQTLSNGPVETGNPGASRGSGVSQATAIAIGVTLGVLAVLGLLLSLLWLRRRRRNRLSSQSGELDTFVDHSNYQPPTFQHYTPVPSMSALSGSILSYATTPHPEARSKVRIIMAPQSEAGMNSDRTHQSNLSSSSSPYGQSTVALSSSIGHQASASSSTAADGTDNGIAVLQHKDSGMRLSEGHHMQTVEVPPSYSVQ